MAGSFSQIYVQIVFAVKNRACLIDSSWEDNLYKYITGIVQRKGQKMIAINGMPDHIHIFIGTKASCCLSELIREIKKASNLYINENKFSKYHFEWQVGFGVFSYSRSHIKNVANYIAKQKEHHAKVSFRKEYIVFLEEYDIDYKNEYLFNEMDDD